MDPAALLDEIRQIAYEGLQFCENGYDRERYERLARLVSAAYGRLASLDAAEVDARFRRELGIITPNLGVDAGIVDEGGRILLQRRRDDGLWALPGGWVNPGETVREAVAREAWEETGLRVVPRALASIVCMPAALPRWPHGSAHLVYRCEVVGGDLRVSHESFEVRYRDPDDDMGWHVNHQERARAALDTGTSGFSPFFRA